MPSSRASTSSDPDDDETAPYVVILNETMARFYFGDESRRLGRSEDERG